MAILGWADLARFSFAGTERLRGGARFSCFWATARSTSLIISREMRGGSFAARGAARGAADAARGLPPDSRMASLISATEGMPPSLERERAGGAFFPSGDAAGIAFTFCLGAAFSAAFSGCSGSGGDAGGFGMALD